MDPSSKTARRLASELKEARKRLDAQEAQLVQTKKDLLASENRLSGLIDQSPFSVQIINADGETINVNKTWEKLWGVSWEEFNKLEYNILQDEQLLEKGITPLLKRALSGENVSIPAIEYSARDTIEIGNTRWVKGYLYPTKDQSGQVTSIVLMHEDVTERRHAREALLEREEQLRLLVENMGDAVSKHLPDSTIIYCSPSWTDLLGYNVEELLGTEAASYVHPNDFEYTIKTIGEAIARHDEQYRLRHRLRRKDGRYVWVETIGKMLFYDSGEICEIQCSVRNIDAQKRAEDGITSQKSATDEYVNSLPGLFYVFDEKRFVRWNKKWESVTGYSGEELSTMYGPDFFEGDDRDLIHERMTKVFTDGYSDAEATLVTKDGRRIPYYFTGQRKKIFGTNQLVGLGIDISDRKKAEEEKLTLERQVQHAQKLKSLGVLAGGIAHDFNNLLMAILGNADLALNELSPMSPVRSNITEIERASQRAADLAKQMLAYSGKGRFVVQPIDAGEIIEEITHLLEVSISKKAVLKFYFSDNLPTFDGDVTQIRQVIMNLITNASEAIGDKNGTIALSTGFKNCDRAYLDDVNETLRAGLDTALPEGVYTYFEVADTGCGMDDKTIEKVFDPFFTTKFTGRGLGMSAVLGIVRGHKAALKIDSEVGKGSTFRVLFPANEIIENDIACQKGKKGVDAENVGGCESGTVLVVDDEEMVCSIAKQMFESMGYNVLVAPNGLVAVDLFKKHADEIVFVLLDLTMPHMDGEEAFREMRLIKPDVIVILSSGYNEQDATRRFAGEGLAGFIQKPFVLEALRKKVWEVFSGSSSRRP